MATSPPPARQSWYSDKSSSISLGPGPSPLASESEPETSSMGAEAFSCASSEWKSAWLKVASSKAEPKGILHKLVPSHQLTWKCTDPCVESLLSSWKGPFLHFHVSFWAGRVAQVANEGNTLHPKRCLHRDLQNHDLQFPRTIKCDLGFLEIAYGWAISEPRYLNSSVDIKDIYPKKARNHKGSCFSHGCNCSRIDLSSSGQTVSSCDLENTKMAVDSRLLDDYCRRWKAERVLLVELWHKTNKTK